MQEDISKASLAVLLVLALIISILSTFTIIKTLRDYKDVPAPQAKTQPATDSGRTGASVGFTIEPDQRQSSSASVSLSIKRSVGE